MGETIQPMGRTATETTVPGAASVEDQLAAFFDANYARMVRLAGLVCRSVLAEDAVQAAMEQAWKRRSSLRDLPPDLAEHPVGVVAHFSSRFATRSWTRWCCRWRTRPS